MTTKWSGRKCPPAGRAGLTYHDCMVFAWKNLISGVMAKQDSEKGKKGTFTALRLAVTRKFVVPASRKSMIQWGSIGAAALLIYFLLDSFVLGKSFVSSGPLSSNHAGFEHECAKCHQSFSAVANGKCSTCHEKSGDKRGVYTFAAHYVYRSDDARRVDVSQVRYGGKEIPCSACHPDHVGRGAKITNVPDARCVRCHEYGSFNKNHPQFEFIRQNVPDDSTLLFTHIRHTKFVLEKLQKEGGGVYLEKACLYCHKPQPDGKNFTPLDYDTQCGDCHLTSSSETPSLAIKDAGNPLALGVETLEMIQKRRGPGTQWAFYTNPNEFTVRGGGKVAKSPVYHKDPWILENLKLLRQSLYSEPGLTDLLPTTGSALRGMAFSEAIKRLQDYSAGLRSRPEPEIQADLARIDSLLRLLQRRASVSTWPDSSLAFGAIENPNLTLAQRKEIEDFALKLTKPCLVCHMVSGASILSVQKDQRALRRAEFDHRAHILQRRCLECHFEIPIAQVFAGDTTVPVAKDRASTQNVPGIENCFECHTEQTGLNRCVTCHYMHPNKENRGNLNLFVEK